MSIKVKRNALLMLIWVVLFAVLDKVFGVYFSIVEEPIKAFGLVVTLALFTSSSYGVLVKYPFDK